MSRWTKQASIVKKEENPRLDPTSQPWVPAVALVPTSSTTLGKPLNFLSLFPCLLNEKNNTWLVWWWWEIGVMADTFSHSSCPHLTSRDEQSSWQDSRAMLNWPWSKTELINSCSRILSPQPHLGQVWRRKCHMGVTVQAHGRLWKAPHQYETSSAALLSLLNPSLCWGSRFCLASFPPVSWYLCFSLLCVTINWSLSINCTLRYTVLWR